MGWFVALTAVAVFVAWALRIRKQAAGYVRKIATLEAKLDVVHRDQSAEVANLKTILASMAEGVMVVDSSHLIRQANRSFLELVELRGDPAGQSVLQAVRDISFEELVSEALNSGARQHAELTLAHVKPARHLTVDAMPIRNASGEVEVLVTCRDVTRLKQLEDVRREFVSNVSHELRTPLAIFQGYLETLLDNPELPTPHLVEVLEILKRHSTRLNALVEDLLVLARLESRTDILCLGTIDPQALTENIVADWRLQATKKSVQLSCECVEGTPEFQADSLRLEQVINNLVENALKYTDAGGTVAVHLGPCGEGVELRVEDTGLGIPPKDLPHIFERFYRADKARSREHGGTGLGLSIVKHIVQLHGGSVRAESTYAKGTTIIVRLPTHAPTMVAAVSVGDEPAARLAS